MSAFWPATRSASALSRVADRHVTMAFLIGLAMSLCWRGLTESLHSEAATVLRDRSGVGAGELLALAVLFVIAFRLGDEDVLSPSDLWTMAIAGLAFALPMRLIALAPLAAVGAKFVFREDPRLRSIGALLLALLFYECLGPLLFHVLSPIALKAEALLVQAFLVPFGGFSRDGLVISGGANGHGVAIEEGCSAFHNLSLATLIGLALIKLETLTMKPLHWWILAAMAVASVALNVVRIAMMAQSYPMYDYWHNGPGVPIVQMAMLGTLLAVFFSVRSLTPKL